MNLYFIASGIDNHRYPFIIKFTFIELATNTGEHKDTELFYTLRELYTKEIEEMVLYGEYKTFQTTRDSKDSVAIICRVSETTYNNTFIKIESE
jgi:hypothetical protein